jgi:exonuclease SbcC
MINQIELINYRSHEHTVLDLDAHVNVIVGRGQAGKTNIKRGVEWVRKNRPLGTKMMNRFAGDDPCEVIITVTNPDGLYRITARRTHKDGMSYHVISHYNGDDIPQEQHFDTPGTKVPDVVTRLLNMDEINIHEQLGAPYLVAGSTGEISRAVNRVIQAEEADKWLTELNSRRNANTAFIKSHTATLEAGEKRLAEMAPLDHVAELLTIVERVERQIAQKERQADRLLQLMEAHQSATNEIDEINRTLEPLTQLIQTAETADAEIQRLEAQASVINAALAARHGVETYEKQYRAAKEQYIQTITELGECPTCFSRIGRDVIRAIEEGL